MEEVNKLFNVRKTIIQMLIDRGYLVSSEKRDESLEEFRSKFSEVSATDQSTVGVNRERLTLRHQKKDDPTNQIFVFFPEDQKVGIKPIKIYSDKMEKEKIDRAILVVRQTMSNFARQALDELKPLKFEVFSEMELMVNITEHKLVPKHVKLSPEEKKQLLQRYKLQETQLPRMMQSDAVARYFGLQRHDVVKIIRQSETAGRYVTYRIVM